MEFWSTGVLRIVRIAPRVRGVGSAFRAGPYLDGNLGLKPRAESCRPFGTGTLHTSPSTGGEAEVETTERPA
jgi:hypothetical protein